MKAADRAVFSAFEDLARMVTIRIHEPDFTSAEPALICSKRN